MDEVLIVPLAGAFDMTIEGRYGFVGRIAGARTALYMTPLHAYTLAPVGPVVVAYARAEAEGRVPVQVVGTDGPQIAERLALRRIALKAGDPLALGGPETLLHVVAGRLDGDAVLEPGQTLALGDGEAARLVARADTDLLLVTA